MTNRIDDRIKSLEINRDITKGRIKNIFESVEQLTEKAYLQDESIANIEKTLEKIGVRLDREVDKLLNLEKIVMILKEEAHCHKVVR